MRSQLRFWIVSLRYAKKKWLDSEFVSCNSNTFIEYTFQNNAVDNGVIESTGERSALSLSEVYLNPTQYRATK